MNNISLGNQQTQLQNFDSLPEDLKKNNQDNLEVKEDSTKDQENYSQEKITSVFSAISPLNSNFEDNTEEKNKSINGNKNYTSLITNLETLNNNSSSTFSKKRKIGELDENETSTPPHNQKKLKQVGSINPELILMFNQITVLHDLSKEQPMDLYKINTTVQGILERKNSIENNLTTKSKEPEQKNHRWTPSEAFTLISLKKFGLKWPVISQVMSYLFQHTFSSKQCTNNYNGFIKKNNNYFITNVDPDFLPINCNHKIVDLNSYSNIYTSSLLDLVQNLRKVTANWETISVVIGMSCPLKEKEKFLFSPHNLFNQYTNYMKKIGESLVSQ